ncbi:MAG TPA: ABC transporter substrate-binding protein [Vineibacter sp.]|nr:ABC transporter substrate-binding protein [Vineibacter sp.]
MRRRAVLASIGALAAAPARGQGPALRIGLLSIGAVPQRPVVWLPFFERMRALGYEEGRTVTYLRGFAAGQEALIEGMARELVDARPALIVITGAREALSVQRLGPPMPCVMIANPDPVGLGSVVSLARPGGRMTGLTTMDSELYGKRLELLRELVPGLARACALTSGTSPIYRPGTAWARELEAAAGTLGIRLDVVQADAPDGTERAMAEAVAGGVGGLLVTFDGHYLAHRETVARAALRHRLPAIYGVSEFVAGGGLMSYSAKIADLSRRAADFADRILRGADPATLPVERPTTFQLTINLAAARGIGLAVPATLLDRADEVIE